MRRGISEGLPEAIRSSQAIRDRTFPDAVDLLILGGGISGTSLYSVADASGQRTLLVDRRDFASGTSQASGMMIWGGLLYLRNFELRLVRRLCRARDWLIDNCPAVHVRRFQYLPLKRGGKPRWLVRLGLDTYRFLSGYSRQPTGCYPLDNLPLGWNPERFKTGLSYEEAFLSGSDSQYTFDWLRQGGGRGMARNYCEPLRVTWDSRHKVFNVILWDQIAARELPVVASRIVNCCGIWTDTVNRKFGVTTDHCHHLSKGVYLLLRPRDNRGDALVVDMEQHGDTLCWVPWGPVVMWGPTETDLENLGKIRVDRSDVDFLLQRLNRESSYTWSERDIVNVRVGVRPLPKYPDQKVKYSLDLSRKGTLELFPSFPWWSLFGGKLSGEYDFARRNYQKIFGHTAAVFQHWRNVEPETTRAFFHKTEVKSPHWSARHEQVFFLEDYLRRRTNIAQWVPRCGFGARGEYAGDLFEIALAIHGHETAALTDLENYRQTIVAEEASWKNPQYWEEIPQFDPENANSRKVSDGHS